MKTINTYITEKLNISKKQTKYTLFPKTKDELVEMIQKEVKQNGNKCSLNHIDTSKITDMSYLFAAGSGYNLHRFNGDISKWNVSNVENMRSLFYNSDFDSDISDWNVSKVVNMYGMFTNSKFTGTYNGISEWDVSNVETMNNMFFQSNFNSDISGWDVLNVTDMHVMFKYSPFNQDISNWRINNNCRTTYMFDKCPIEDKYKPFKNGKRL